jgi:HTH-type transcriptional regulator/antitoxin HipB
MGDQVPSNTIESTAEAARLVRDRRLALGLTQQDLATLAGVGRSVVQKLEAPSGAISLPGFLRLLQALSLDLRASERAAAAAPAGEQHELQPAPTAATETTSEEEGRYRVWVTIGPPTLSFQAVARIVRHVYETHPHLGVVASGSGRGGQELSFGCDAAGATAARRLARRALVDAIRHVGLTDEVEIGEVRVVIGT